MPAAVAVQGLEWMLRRERKGEALGRSLLRLHPAWIQIILVSSGLVLYLHKSRCACMTHLFYPAPASGTCGGFLCECVSSCFPWFVIVPHATTPGELVPVCNWGGLSQNR